MRFYSYVGEHPVWVERFGRRCVFSVFDVDGVAVIHTAPTWKAVLRWHDS